MTLGPHQTRPQGRNLSDFLDEEGNLQPAEQKLLAAAASGEPCIIAEERPEEPTAENTIRAPFLRFLALGGDDKNALHENGIQLSGAWIEETLGLNFCTLLAPLRLNWCYLSQLVAIQATMPALQLSDSLVVNGLIADRITVTGSVFLRDNFKATGVVRLPGARIGGDIECDGGTFIPKDGDALICDGAEVKGNVFLNDDFTSKGTVRLIGARIGGNLECNDGTFAPETGNALSFDSAEIKGNVFLGNGFSARSEVRLIGARIGGDLTCRGGKFTPKTGDALSCDGAEIKGDVSLDNGFNATGEVRLLGARISGSLVDNA